jgi:hemoglobin
MDASTQSSLYERLGEKDGITRIVEDVMAAHLTNPIVSTRFENSRDIDHAKRMAAEFFCAGCGGPEAYTGRDMLTTHRGMNISEQEYMAVMDDILRALGKNGIDQGTQSEVVAVLYSLKNQIIRV